MVARWKSVNHHTRHIKRGAQIMALSPVDELNQYFDERKVVVLMHVPHALRSTYTQDTKTCESKSHVMCARAITQK